MQWNLSITGILGTETGLLYKGFRHSKVVLLA